MPSRIVPRRRRKSSIHWQGPPGRASDVWQPNPTLSGNRIALQTSTIAATAGVKNIGLASRASSTSTAVPERASLASTQGEWNAETATGYRTVARAPQFRLRVATSARARITVKTLPLGVFTQTSFALAVASAKGFRVTDYKTCAYAFGTFSNSDAVVEMDLSADVPYTLIAATYDTTGRGKFQVDVVDATSGLPLTLSEPLCLLGPLTLEQSVAADAASKSKAGAHVEREARKQALLAMRAAAAASPPGSAARESWRDFCAASEEVERLRAEVRARGPAARFADGWSGPRAIGAGWTGGNAAVWRDIRECAPNPVVIEDGFSLADVQQGELGNCYFIACLANLVLDNNDSQRVLHSVFVTAETNPEGVFCVRLWSDDRWVWYFLDATLPTYAGSHKTSNSDKCWAGAPNASEGKYALPVSVRSLAMNEFWPCLLEKAWARAHGSYAAIEANRVGEADIFSSFPLMRFLPHSIPCPPLRLADAPDMQWATLERYAARKWPMTISAKPMASSNSRAGRGGRSGDGVDTDGIVRNHAFSLLRVFSFFDATKNQTVRLLELRNPHGGGEWTGAYSDTDLSRWTPALRAATGYDPEAGGDDG